MKISKLYQLIGNDIVEIPLVDVEELNDRLLNIENNYLTKEDANSNYLSLNGGTITNTLSILNKNAEIGLVEQNNFSSIYFRDKDGTMVGAVEHWYANAAGVTQLYTKTRKNDGTNVEARISLRAGTDGICYASSPAPQENTYSNQIDTLRSSINRHPVKIEVGTNQANIYVGGSNASDTANLWQGRGTSPEMPFARLEKALIYAEGSLVSASYPVIINISGDINLSSDLYLYSSNFQRLSIRSVPGGSGKLIANNNVIYSETGNNFIENIDLSGIRLCGEKHSMLCLTGNINMTVNDSANAAIISRNCGYIACLNDLVMNMSGTTSASVLATSDGTFTAAGTWSGSITGKRYQVTYGGRIITYGRGANAFPGTIDGTCDANSKYF